MGRRGPFDADHAHGEFTGPGQDPATPEHQAGQLARIVLRGLDAGTLSAFVGMQHLREPRPVRVPQHPVEYPRGFHRHARTDPRGRQESGRSVAEQHRVFGGPDRRAAIRE